MKKITDKKALKFGKKKLQEEMFGGKETERVPKLEVLILRDVENWKKTGRLPSGKKWKPKLAAKQPRKICG